MKPSFFLLSQLSNGRRMRDCMCVRACAPSAVVCVLMCIGVRVCVCTFDELSCWELALHCCCCCHHHTQSYSTMQKSVWRVYVCRWETFMCVHKTGKRYVIMCDGVVSVIIAWFSVCPMSNKFVLHNLCLVYSILSVFISQMVLMTNTWIVNSIFIVLENGFSISIEIWFSIWIFNERAMLIITYSMLMTCAFPIFRRRSDNPTLWRPTNSYLQIRITSGNKYFYCGSFLTHWFIRKHLSFYHFDNSNTIEKETKNPKHTESD